MIEQPVESITYRAGKQISVNGRQVDVGEEVPEAPSFQTLEAMVSVGEIVCEIDGEIVRNPTESPLVMGKVREDMAAAPVLPIHGPEAYPWVSEPIRPLAQGAAEAPQDVDEPVEESVTEEVEEEGLSFDPSEFTVAEVTEYALANPDEAAAILDAEAKGKNRKSLISNLAAIIEGN